MLYLSTDPRPMWLIYLAWLLTELFTQKWKFYLFTHPHVDPKIICFYVFTLQFTITMSMKLQKGQHKLVHMTHVLNTKSSNVIIWERRNLKGYQKMKMYLLICLSFPFYDILMWKIKQDILYKIYFPYNWLQYCLVPNILQNIFYCVSWKK